jgi:hypothetical protein
MLQPFERFRLSYIPRLIELNKPILVSQTYSRAMQAFGDGEKKGILLSDYDDMGLAKIHYKAVIRDEYAAIIDLSKPAHRAKLEEMLEPESGYQLFWSVVKSKHQLEQKINAVYKDKMRDYITNHTTWRIDRDTTIRPSVQMIFGELFIVIKYGKQVIRIKFEELENA